VLVVDDNRDAAISLAMWLELKGYEAKVAHEGETALHAAETFQPAIVLLDLGLPGLDGHDVCRRIRAQRWGRAMRVIALTGFSREEARRATAASGFDSHLVKPVDLAALDALLGATR